MIRKKLVFLLSLFSVASLIIVYSCSKEEVLPTKTNNNKGTNPYNTFSSGNSGSNFSSGNNGFNFSSGNSGNNFSTGNNGFNFSTGNTSPDDASCLVGVWIIQSNSCSQGYHLKLIFNSDGTGDAIHLDEYLCTVNMRKTMLWKLEGGILKIKYTDIYTGEEDFSETTFSCPSNSLTVQWNYGNIKTLTKVNQ